MNQKAGDRKVRRAGILAHFDRHGIVDEYVFKYIEALLEVCDHFVFVSTSEVSDEQLRHLNSMCDQVILREDVGYDFYSWKTAISELELNEFDELIICNDSCYGPFHSLAQYFDKMEETDADYWAFTSGYHKHWHLQPYFAVFRSRLLHSADFMEFWNGVEALNKKWDIIEKYEVGLSYFLVRRGYRVKAMYSLGSKNLWDHIKYYLWALMKVLVLFVTFPFSGFVPLFREWRQNNMSKAGFVRIFLPNVTHYLWSSLLKCNVPLLKIELLRDNPTKRDISKWRQEIQSVSSYDTSIIERHLRRMHSGVEEMKRGRGRGAELADDHGSKRQLQP